MEKVLKNMKILQFGVLKIKKIMGNGNITISDTHNSSIRIGNAPNTCKNCKYFEQGDNPYNGNCQRLLMSILKPQPKKFMVRVEFGCNLHELKK